MDTRRPHDPLLEHVIDWLFSFLAVDHHDMRVCERGQRLILLTHISITTTVFTLVFSAAGIWLWPGLTSPNVDLVLGLSAAFLCATGLVLALTRKGRVNVAVLVWMGGVLVTLLGTMLLNAAEWHLHLMSSLVILIVIAALVLGYRAALVTSAAISILEILFIALIVRRGYADLIAATICQNMMVGAMMAFYTYSDNLEGRGLYRRRSIQLSPAYIDRVSRDFNMALSMVLEYSRLILAKDGAVLSADSKLAMIKIEENTGRLLESVDDFMDFLELERGAVPVQMTASDPSMLFYMLLNQLGAHAVDRGLRFSCVFDPQIPSSVLQDWLLLRHALVRLLENSIASTRAGGHVAVSAHLRGRHEWDIEIRDNGDGFDLPDRWESLEPIDGPGMSHNQAQRQWLSRLALAAALTRYIGGCLRIRTARYEGSVVTLSLPLKGPDKGQ